MNKEFDNLALVIGDKYIKEARKSAAVVNPANNQQLGTVPFATDKDLNQVVNVAQQAFAGWKETSPQQRCAVLARCAEALKRNTNTIARITTLEQGKTLAESVGEWDRVVDTLNWHAAQAHCLDKIDYPNRGKDLKQVTSLEPVGVSLALTAWNFPAILPVRKIAPALVAGCPVILKASEETPMSAFILVQALIDSGVPPGVINLIFGDPAHVSSTLLQRPEIRKVSFTGSIPVGKLLAEQASRGLKRCTFELGGHAPAIVFEDANVELAATTLASFKYRNAGQVCVAPSRFFVQQSIAEKFTEIFVEYARELIIGDGLQAGVTMGPMANGRRVLAMRQLLEDAVSKGANVAWQTKQFPSMGHFYPPTVLTDVPNDAMIMNEEPFGPVAPIVSFDSEEKVISQVNRLEYGLASYLFTADEARGRRMGSAIEAGSVAVNLVIPAQPDTPFGGVKESGYGYEGGLEGIHSYMAKKLISAPAGFV